MQITQNTVVTLDYNVTDTQGNLLDEGAQPIVYLHGGYGGIFAKIEEHLQGSKTGDHFDLHLEPQDAFGDYDADLVAIEPRHLFPEHIEVGMQFERASEDPDEDSSLYIITDIADDQVVVDANHPLAGMALRFSCTITGVRPASSDEIAHGHVHGTDAVSSGANHAH
jgi:FKBP-type peptidyl-prolyl cis-trans isomerase SlyD